MHFEKSGNAVARVQKRPFEFSRHGRGSRLRAEAGAATGLSKHDLRREADAAGDVQVSSLLESLEPILLDIANLPAKPSASAVRVIRERVERKNIVALLQVNSTALARALD
jgi:hypothetical protein